jgi:hypothetical protein
MFLFAAVVLVAGVWWAIVMPSKYYIFPAEGPPIAQDNNGARIALGAISVVAAVALATIAYSLRPPSTKN